ncbi:uncharacterized protein LOC129771950 isoform X2 [Toxorhynchites rutilus septentrionalis]|uniref:uncharacterized protein LOC129771950 isoform X2 n=1 Tax=Toxorhynchites rutilus septentrionalis TaxID=329112 RepID=UPI00247951C0|nr:uncharacterized protein LOC129771950 isoform X2 [Toxorhynchites rutilus septentrionalis]
MIIIMTELAERERINKELREKAHEQLEVARDLLDKFSGNEDHKKLLKTQYSKFEGLISDRNKRLKSDTLRKFIESIQILVNKVKIKSEPVERSDSSVDSSTDCSSSQSTTVESKASDTVKPISSETDVQKITPSLEVCSISSPTKAIESPTKSVITTEEVDGKQKRSILLREVISEEAKLKQKPQIPWRTPTRLEPLSAVKNETKTVTKSVSSTKKSTHEPERFALRYKTKKRPTCDIKPSGNEQFKKPFPIPPSTSEDHQRPLFQRRHQLPPAKPLYDNNRDPRTHHAHYNRYMYTGQNRLPYEGHHHHQQVPRHHFQVPPNRPAAAAYQFAVPAPVPPTRPNVSPTRPNNPPAVRARFVSPAAPLANTKPAARKAAAKPVIRPEKTINPVFSKDDLIPLGSKENVKKISCSVKTTTNVEKSADTAEKSSQNINSTPDAEKTDKQKSKPVVQKVTEPVVENKKKEVSEKNEQSKTPVDQTKTDERNADGSPLDKNLLSLLKGIADESKVKQILDVMSKHSDDESEKQQTSENKCVQEKKAKKFKRIRTKTDESSSEDDASKKDNAKKGKAKTTKHSSSGSREVIGLLNFEWIGKGGEISHTRRRGTSGTQTHSKPATKQARLQDSSSDSDEEIMYSSPEKLPKTAVEEDSLLTIAKSPPTKGKQKQKEATFVYNDKKTVHFNSNYASNCALCSFNGSAIVNHYVYDHKQYEVFVSRVSPKMAEIIRADPFLTNGTLANEESGNESINFKCFFCLASKELTRSEWCKHLASHTGEYRYRCTSCPVMSQAEELDSSFFHEKSCLKPSLAVYNNIEFEDNHLYGFICNACNYIQVRRVNMERHLKREHPSADVGCIRFSIVNYKIDTKPIIDEDQEMKDSSASHVPTVSIPLLPKAEPLEPCDIVNQPFTEDEEMQESEAEQQQSSVSRRRDYRLDSIHIGPAGVCSQLSHKPFSIKFEQELQGDQISSSSGFYESPMSPVPTEDDAAEAQSIIPVMQIQSIQGGFDAERCFVKREDKEMEYDSDASDKTTDFDMFDTDEAPESLCDGEQKTDGNSNDNGAKDGATNGGNSRASTSGTNSGTLPSVGGAVNSGTGGGGSGSGGDDDDNRKKEKFPLPLNIKQEKEEKNKKEKEEKMEKETEEKKGEEKDKIEVKTVVIKSEKKDDGYRDHRSQQEVDGEGLDFVELVLDSTRIEHVAFVEQKSEILYLCLMPGCRLVTKKIDDFKNHVSKKHESVTWDGYCHPCQSQIMIMENCLIANELQHLLDVHARRKTPTLEISAISTAPSTLRIRKMPGDTLSAVDSNVPPPLAPLLPPSTSITPVSSSFCFGQSPLIIQSAATISPVPMGNNSPMMTPTHTIPAQIRPIIANPPPAATMIPNVPPPLASVQSSSGGGNNVSMAGLILNSARLKPWTNMITTKNQEHCLSMLEETSLLCLYKCMARTCAFTTNNRFFMEQHMSLHEAMYSSLATHATRKCWLECAYCDLIAPNNIVLLTHIDSEHAACGFQCNLCFYRSRDPTNVVVHQKTYHPNSGVAKKILIMPENLKSFGDDEWRSMQESLRKNVLPLQCTICKDSYYILSAYMTHLASHEQNFICCQVCNLNIEKKSMARHLLLHSIGLYECVYCLFGANTKSTMALHVSNAHSSKPLYCCVRYNKKRPDGVEYPPNKVESMELKTMSCTVSPDLFKRCSYSTDQLNNKPVSLNVNDSIEFQKKVSTVTKIPPSTVATFSTNAPTPAANIQIQITDEAGRPLIISIPVQNSSNNPTVQGPAAPSCSQPASAPSPAMPQIQMPMISTVQGGVQNIPPSPPSTPLPVISSVQGMVSLPPLTAIQRSDGLPIISSVQSVAHLPPDQSLAAPLKSPSVTISPEGLVILPNIPGTTITAKPAIVTSTTTSSSTASISTASNLTVQIVENSACTLVPKPKTDMYTTTVAEADTQSCTVSGENQEYEEDVGANDDKSESPAPSDVSQPGSSKDTTGLKKFSSTTQIRIDFLFNGSIEKFDRLERKVNMTIKHTGFSGLDLNICGVEKCNGRFSDPVKLNLHLLKHHNVANYKCYHCSDRFKTAHELITHIKTHGWHRYLCFLCDRKSHFLKMMILHVQHDHNSTDVILSYLHPKKRDIHNDLVVICPQDVTGVQLRDYVENILKEDATLIKNRFTPDEIDQLPEKDIFSEDVFCASCNYRTKIKKNMKRHLEKHLGELLLTDNSASTDRSTVSTTTTSEMAIPEKIDPIKLYQCGICKFECPPALADFRAHMYLNHRNEKQYKCLHCNQLINEGIFCVDSITNHLKLHGNNLYKCSECDYYRDEQYLITAHIQQNHDPSVPVAVIREAIVVTTQPEWQCDLCETIRQTRAEMVDHMTADHKLTDNQYKCSLCSFKSSENDAFKAHFASNHPASGILIISLFHELPPKQLIAIANESAMVTTGGSETAHDDRSKRSRYSCGTESCSFSSNDLPCTKEHFLASHPDQTLVVFDDSITEKEKRKRFDYFVRYVCNYCQVQCDTVDDIVEHWNKQHKDEDGAKPLMFKLFKLVQCFYCDQISSYYNIKSHALVSHPAQTFACVDYQNVFKCGECPFVLTGEKVDLLKHFKIYHHASKNEDPCDYIDDDFLHRMLEQNNSMYTCNHCELTFDSRFTYENHIDTCAFAGLPSSFSLTTKSVRIRYICSCCNDLFSSEYSIAKHMRTHLAQYNCRYCKREFKQLTHLNEHQILLHNAYDNDFSLKDLDQYRSFFLKIKMLFPNGLLLSKVDAHRTVCGSVEDILNYVRSANDEEMTEVMYNRAILMPLHYEDDEGKIVQVQCKKFLERQPTMVLQLENLSEDKVAQITEQVYLLAKVAETVGNNQQHKRGRQRKIKKIVTSDTDDDDDDDDDWRPERKRIKRTSAMRVVTKKEVKSSSEFDSDSDNELLIRFKNNRDS